MAQCSTRSLKTGRNGQPLLRSETLVGANRRVGEKKRSPFAVSDHDLNGIEEVFCGPIGIAEFTCGLQIVPSNLQGHRDDVLQRLAHEDRT